MELPPSARFNALRLLCRNYFGVTPQYEQRLSAHASPRQIVRFKYSGRTVIGRIGPDRVENETFIYLSSHFLKYGLAVPEVYLADLDHSVYIEEDLGDKTLYAELDQTRTQEEPFPAEIEALYKEALTSLVRFQVVAGKDLDYSRCQPKQVYDKASMLWDMHYFRDSFLTKVGIPFQAQELEQAFQDFANTLSKAEANFFLYRDFQSRNIMLKDGKLAYIDFQAGRKGPLHYDLVSLLYQSKAAIPKKNRLILRDFYLSQLTREHKYDRAEFLSYFDSFVLLQLLHTLGTYGKQGLELKKQYFLESIPLALSKLEELMPISFLSGQSAELKRVLEALVEDKARISKLS